MNPRVQAIKTFEDYTVSIVFDNGEERLFNVEPYLDKGFFKELRDLPTFHAARVERGTVCWKNGQDFCPDTLYLESVRVNQTSVQAVAENQPDYGPENERQDRSNKSV